jgi:hypothetical protein
MINSTMMRKILWVGVAFNAVAALMLAFPNSLGALVGLPPVGSIFYPWLLAFFVALFGATYAFNQHCIGRSSCSQLLARLVFLSSLSPACFAVTLIFVPFPSQSGT